MKTTTFKFFNDIEILRFIGQVRMARLLEPYRTDLAALSLQLPPAQPETAGYCPQLAPVLAYPDALPQKLRACLLALENAASPENCCELEAAIDRSPVRNHRFHPLDRALELHFQAPELLKPFEIVGDEVAVTSPPLTNHDSPSCSRRREETPFNGQPPAPLIVADEDHVARQQSEAWGSKSVADLGSQTSPPITSHDSPSCSRRREETPFNGQPSAPLIVGDGVTSPPPCDPSLSSSSKLVADLGSQTSPPVTNHDSPSCSRRREETPFNDQPPAPLIVTDEDHVPRQQSEACGSKSVADLGSQTSPPVTNHRSLITSHDDAIQNQNSKFKNPSPDSAVFAHLASLSPAQYDRTRKQSARQLGIRVQTLDAEISRLRKQLVEDEMFQTALATLRSPEPWPEPVDAAELLTRIVERFRHYVILPPGAAEVFTLWSAHAHCFSAFIQSPRLNISSPKPGCGKTTALDVIATLTPRALRTENLTAPVLFRLVHQYQPTLLLDEVDSWLPQAEELRGLLNAGHKRGACAYRCEGEGNAVRPFRAFGPAVLAGIGQLTGTLHDRSIVVPLAKAEEGQIPHRFNDERIEIETELCRKLARWTADNLAALKSCDPILPPTAFNRLADNWRPLFAIAQIAGGNWPSLALDSFNYLAAPRSSSSSFSFSSSIPSPLVRTLSPASPISSSPSVSPPSPNSNPNHQLLTDLRQIFTQSGLEQLSSRHLVQALCRLPESPWLEAHNRRPINETWLGRRLRMFDIASCNLRFDARQARGYQLADFADAFARFLDNGKS
ncbi:MAG TPA: DUF3631 domain-containing protein [Candidatus Dormibacteraeota bacterium]|nr:DUF3631 domain-containing protein [Candidatus Dormibacteraeota bacterium]